MCFLQPAKFVWYFLGMNDSNPLNNYEFNLRVLVDYLLRKLLGP